MKHLLNEQISKIKHLMGINITDLNEDNIIPANRPDTTNVVKNYPLDNKINNTTDYSWLDKYDTDPKKPATIKKIQKDPSVNNIKTYPKCVQKFGDPIDNGLGVVGIEGKDQYKDFIFYNNLRYIGPNDVQGYYYCDIDKIRTSINKPITHKDGQVIPVALGGVKGVKRFQDWLDVNFSDWLKKYGTIDKDPKKGYGYFGPSTKAKWLDKKIQDAFLNNKYINQPIKPLTKPDNKPVQIDKPDLKPDLKLIQPDNLPSKNVDKTEPIVQNQQKNQTGQEIYKILYDGNLIRTSTFNKNQLVIDNTKNYINDEQIEKLKDYLSSLPVSYSYKTTRENGKLIFVKNNIPTPQ